MTYQAPGRSAPVVVGIFTLHSVGVELALSAQQGAGASAVWPAADRAIFVPFYLSERMTATKMFVANGAAVSGSLDLGIYDAAGTRLVSSGSTAQAGITTTQVVDITDTTLSPGTYYMAMAMDNITGTTLRSAPSLIFHKSMGIAQQASAFPLPATATLAASASTYIPFMGVSFRTVAGSV